MNRKSAWDARLHSAAFFLSFGSASSILFSIALSQILLALALIAVLIARRPLRFPPIKAPLTAFFAVTVAAVLASGDVNRGLPQIRKFFVFAIVLVLYNSFTSFKQIRALFFTWFGVALLSAVASFVQLWHRHQMALQQNANDYGFYLDGRLTGFASHWMTFGGEQMIVLLMLLSLLLFSPERKGKYFGLACLIPLWVSIVLGLTRSIFLLAAPVGLFYLLWNRQRRAATLAAVSILAVSMLIPFHVRDRVVSVAVPHKEVDSNLRRIIMIRTGWAMVKAHPVLGLGPEQIQPQFSKYVPSDVARPLPKGWYGHLHNMYLQYAAERGILGLAMIMWLIGKVLLDFRSALKRKDLPGEARYCLRGAVATTLAILIEGLFEYNLGDSEVLTMFLVVVTLAYLAVDFRSDSDLSLLHSNSVLQPVEVLAGIP
jgi:O-antigen ligase